MKKVLLTIGIIIIGLILFWFYPEQVTLKYGTRIPQVNFDVCKGFYVETHNTLASDGEQGGLCFGQIITITKPLDRPTDQSGSCTSDKGNVMTFKQALDIAEVSDCVYAGIFTNRFSCNPNSGGIINISMEPHNSPGCGVMCLVSIDTSEAKQGWMCTGNFQLRDIKRDLKRKFLQ